MKIFLSILVCIGILISTNACSFEIKKYEEKGFNAEIYAGSLVVLVFKSEKCQICDGKINSIYQLLKIPRYKEMKVFSINFDYEKSIVKKFDVINPGTIILMKGNTEVFRSSDAQTQKVLEFEVARALN